MSLIIWLKVSKWIKFLPLIYYVVVNFVVGQSMIISQDFELTLTETQSTQEVSLDVKIHRSITLVPGYSYEINCNYKMGGFRGEQNIWFHFNDTPVLVQNTTATLVAVYAIEVDINNWKLVLQQFRETDSGVYTCRGASSSVSLDISYRSGNPTVLSSTPELRLHHGVQQGSRPTLIAFVSGNPQPSRSDITWYFNNQSLPSSILQDGNKLLLPSNIGFDLAGKYTCQVTTSAGIASDTFVITIIRQPAVAVDTLSQIYGWLVAVNNSAAVLTCSDSVGVPIPSFNWTYADIPTIRIAADDRIMILNYTNGQLSSSMRIIDPVLTSDSGWYTCTAFNDAGHSSQRIYVDVHFKPNLKPYPTSTPVQAMLGSSATLQTLLVNANPMDVTIRWLGPSGDVVADSQYSSFNISNGTVYIVNLMTLTPSSGGVYTCEIENSIGTSNVNFTLLVIVSTDSFLQLRMYSVYNCTSWIEQNHDQIQAEIIAHLVDNINRACFCGLMSSHFTKSVICCQNSETQVVFKAHLRYTMSSQNKIYSADDLITQFLSWISNGSTLTVVNTTFNVDSSLPTKLKSLTDVDCVDLNPDTLDGTSCPVKLNDDKCDDPKSPAYDTLIIIWECTLTLGVLFVIIITVTVILVTQYVHQRKKSSSHELQSQSINDELAVSPVYEIASEFSEVSKQNQIVQVKPNIAYETCMPGPALEPNIAYEIVGFQQQNNPTTCAFQEVDETEPAAAYATLVVD